MSNCFKIVAGLALASALVACGQPRSQEAVYGDVPAVQPEPVYSKY